MVLTQDIAETRNKKITIISCLFLVFTTLVSLTIGKYNLTFPKIVSLLLGHGSAIEKNVFFRLRIPRTIMAIMAGSGLGLSGAVYQMVFKNPLASPDVIGISSGANLGAAIIIVMFGGSVTAIAVGSFLGGVLAVVCVMGLVRATKSNSTSTYVLSGIIISSVASAMIMLLKYFVDNEGDLAAIEYWTMGSLSAVTLSKVLGVLPFWLIGFVLTLLLNRQVGLLNLNEDEARALGVKLKQIRIVVLTFSTMLVSSIICVTGLISFAGLIAPHIVTLLINRQNSKSMVLSAIIGAEVLLVSDILARIIASSELPISVLTTIIGVPILVIVMIKKNRKSL